MAKQPNIQPSQHPTTPAHLTIGELADRCGTTPRALRYYEEQDLITPSQRSKGGYRLYAEETIKRINAIMALQDLGYSLSNITEMLGTASDLANPCSKVQRIEHTRKRLHHQQKQLSEKLAALQNIQDTIEARLKVLEAHCGLCQREDPTGQCASDCQHADVHTE